MRSLIENQGLVGALRLMVLVGAGSATLAYAGSTVVGVYASHDAQEETSSDSEGLIVEDALARLAGGGDTGIGTLADGARAVTIADYVPEEGRFIGVDLVADELTLYEDGLATFTAKVIAKSAQSGADALEAGLYVVEAKDERFFSAISKQYLPSRLQFNDRFSIHGVPESAEGAVPTDGVVPGVTLAPHDAVELFGRVGQGTTLFILGERPYTGAVGALEVEKGTFPALSARAYALSDVVTGHSYLSKNADLRYPIASITKIMTSLVANEVVGTAAQVELSRTAHYTAGDLYYPLYLRSDNGVANALAEHRGVPAFIARMNTQARAIGMYSTRFADPSGLSPKNVSSAYDLTLLARYLYNSERVFLDISSSDTMSITSSEGYAWHLKNQNRLAEDPHFIGGKLGFTDEARQTSLALFSVPIEGRTRVVSVIILGSDDWKQDTRTLLTWFLENARAESS